MTVDANLQRLSFDRFVVDDGRRLLLRDGVAVPLHSKAFDLLVALLERRGEVIDKDDLLARVWPNQVVEEGNLTVHVSALRKALGERRGEHRFIVTVPGRGYRFVGETANGGDAAPVDTPVAPVESRRAVRRDVAVVLVAAVLVVVAVATWRQMRTAAADSTRVPPAMTTRLLTAVGNISTAVLSPDAKTFAYVAFQDGVESLWLGHVDGTPPAPLRAAEDVDYQSLVFAPQGDRIFYAVLGSLYQIPLSGGEPRRVLDGVGGGFALSPDATRVAFVRRDARTKTSGIVIGDVGSGRERVAVSLPAGRAFSGYGPAWSPDGAFLAVGTSAAASKRFALTRVRVADGSMTPMSSDEWDEIGKLAWARDGGGVAFNAVGANSDFHIWFLETPGGRLRCVTPDLSRYGRASVSMSDDGRSLLAVRGEINSTIWVAPSGAAGDPRPVTSRAFGKLDGSAGLSWTPDGRIVYASFVNNSYSLWTLRADGADARPLTSAGYVDRFPQATPDGRSIVFDSNRGGGNDLWRVDADGSHLRQLTFGGRSTEPGVTPDGRWIVFTSAVDGVDAIWKVSIDGGTPIRVTRGPSGWPSVSPDGTRMAIASAENASGETRLAVVAIDTGKSVADFAPARSARLTNGLRWTADGSAVVYRDFSQGLWRQPLAGGAPEKLPGAPDKRIYFFDWSGDRRQMAMSYGDEVRDVVLMSGFR